MKNTLLALVAKFRTFRNEESGAVTVDYVVLTAAVVGLGLVVAPIVSSGLTTSATALSTKLEAASQ